VIGHMKAEGHLGRCYLKGRAGDDRVRPKPVIGPLEIGHDCREQLPSALMRKPHVIEHHLEWGNARGGDLRLPAAGAAQWGALGRRRAGREDRVAEPKAEAPKRGRAVVVPVNCSKNSQEQVR
jgi:hypothetical protein